MMEADPTRDRAVGALLGLAVGDAIGTTLEFCARDAGPLIDDMVGGGPFGLEPGQWTDDTSMALCLADSLTAKGGLDQTDLMQRFCRFRALGQETGTAFVRSQLCSNPRANQRHRDSDQSNRFRTSKDEIDEVCHAMQMAFDPAARVQFWLGLLSWAVVVALYFFGKRRRGRVAPATTVSVHPEQAAE